MPGGIASCVDADAVSDVAAMRQIAADAGAFRDLLVFSGELNRKAPAYS
jgi:hypothetical protein